MKKVIVALLLMLPLLAFAQEKKYVVVSVSAANLRAEPDYESPLETQALMGSVMEVLDSSNYWLKVHLLEPSYTAWVNRLQVHPCASSVSSDYIVKAKYSTLYEEPSERSAVICDLVRGDLLQKPVRDSEKGGSCASRSRKGFVAVTIPSTSRMGWVRKRDLCDPSTLDGNGQSIVDEALSYLGTPYLWGGTTVKGFDCSGLVRQCYLMAGIKLPRNASEQLHEGEELSVEGVLEGRWDHLRPGDLLFFGNRQTGRVSHVAIYAGNGHIVHSSMVVRYNSLLEGSEDYYENAWRLLYARRMLH
ncbi:MAG: C40 family peptidase [Bacteroidales bacterium]|nr:C40 family peptidase [Bacteroidales bacterium]